MNSTSPHSVFVAERRKAASVAGRPLERLAGPAIYSARGSSEVAAHEMADHFRASLLAVWLSGGKLMACDGRSGAMTITPGLLKELIETKATSIVCTEPAAFDALVRKMERLGNPVATQIAYQLRAVRRIPSSTQVGVLTELLDRKFWLPEGADTRSIKAWKNAFGAPSGSAGVISLINSAAGSSESGTPPPMVGTAVKELRAQSRTVWEKAASGGDQAAIASFLAAEKAGEAASAIRSFDRLGRHEVATDGSSARITPFAALPNSNVLAVISQPCRIKPGKRVQLLSVTDERKIGTAELAAITFDPNRGLVGEFRPASVTTKKDGTKKISRGFTPMDRAWRDGTEFVIATEPFFGNGTGFQGRAGRMWTDRKPPTRVVGRDVPMDVVMAGAVN